jgi:RimJ/RimL family protein N-acetyltransferase
LDPIVPLTLETPRLVLRTFEERDCDALQEMFGDEDCVRYTIAQPLAPWQTWRALASYVGHWQLRGYGPYAVVEKATGSMLGPVGLWFPSEWPEPEIKWSLAKRFWGLGFATEAAVAVRNMAAGTLNRARLISLVRPGNTRSASVARRLGGVLEKTIPFRGDVAAVYAYDLKRPAPVASSNPRALPPWISAEILAAIDLSELAEDSPGLVEECVRLGKVVGANVAAYRSDARGLQGGLCSYYRAANLSPALLRELTRAERTFLRVVFVAYQSRLARHDD